jgi:sterol desaturase/sphingolipid hydroxylase (fatty acid hydroxylase superfamily)
MPDFFHNPQERQADSLVRAIAGHDANAHLPIVARTRRAVRIANDTRREQGKIGRRTLGIALFTLGALIVLVAPTLWNSIDDVAGGEHFGDLPLQITLISTLLMMSVVAALVILWRSRSSHDGYDHRP